MGCCASREKIENNPFANTTPFDDSAPTPFVYNNQYQTAKWKGNLDPIEQAVIEEGNNRETKEKITIENEKNNSEFIKEIEDSSEEEKEIEVNTNNNNNQYTSINSVTIKGKGNAISQNDTNSEIANSNINEDNINNNPVNFILTDTLYFFYFDIQKFILHEKSYLLSIYPELNIIMTIEINDDKASSIKIPFVKSSESKGNVSYLPLLNDSDVTSQSSHVLIPFRNDNHSDIFKVSICFFTYVSHKLCAICNDDIYISMHSEDEIKKVNLHRNFYLKHYNKKIGNLIYEYSYMTKEVRRNISNEEIESLSSNILYQYKQCNSMILFEDEYLNKMIYYKIDDVNLFDENYDKKVKSDDFVTVTALNTDIQGMINKNKDDLRFLMSILKDAKKKYDIYYLLQNLSLHFQKSEFTYEDNISLKEYIITILNQIMKSKFKFIDDVLIPYLFSVLKLLIFKLEKKKKSNPNKELKEKNDKIITNVFHLCFNYIVNRTSVDVSLSALNFLSKYLEDNNYEVVIKEKKIKGYEVFFNIVVDKKYYMKLFDVYLKYYDYQACATPLTNLYSKMLNSKIDRIDKENISSFFKTKKNLDIIKKSLKIYDCNSTIISNIFSIYIYIISNRSVDEDKKDFNFYTALFNIISISKIKENFLIFRSNGWDSIHEITVRLLKLMLKKRTLLAKENLYQIKEEDFIDTSLFFSYMLSLMYERIKKLKLERIIKFFFIFLNHISSIGYFYVNNPYTYLTVNSKTAKIINERNIIEGIIDILEVANKIHLFNEIDSVYNGNFFDINLINIKISILKNINGLITFFKFAKNKLLNKPLSSDYIKKVQTAINSIKSNERLNPQMLSKEIEAKKLSENDSKPHKELLSMQNEYYNKLISNINEEIF